MSEHETPWKNLVDEVLSERGERYGKWEDNASISQAIKTAMTREASWFSLDDSQREALEVIAQKMARIINGDSDYIDNWLDIAGYATLEVKRCENKT